MAFRGSSPIGERRISAYRLVPAALVLALSALLALDAAWWFRAQHQLDRGVRHVLALAADAGWRATARTGERGGWPWSAGVALRDPAIEAPNGSRWTGDGLGAALYPPRGDRITLDASGTQTLLLRLRGAAPLLLRAWGSRIAASWPTRAPGRIDLAAEALHMALGGLGPDDAIQAATLSVSLRPAPEGARLVLEARDLALPAPSGVAGNRILPVVRLSLLLPGLFAGPGAVPSPARWRAAGGHLVVERAVAEWGGASAELSGQATTGTDGAPSGRFSLLIRDPDVLLDRLRDAGLIGTGEVLAVRAVLDVIRTGENGPGRGDGGPVRLLLTLEDGLLSLGRIPIARLPVLAAAR